ncbi:MAG: ABC transporter substrate-binding protein [Bacteroidales bacterium]|nr:ABC transporter substrate-binding protein [Bacteroidales bacterium]
MKSKLLIAAIFTTFVCACSTSVTNSEHERYIYTDDYGAEVSIPKCPKRVVSVSPAVTEIIFALGADSILVGRTDFCQYPDEAINIESIGGISNLNVEKVISLHPDLVISGSMVPQKAVEQINNAGVPLVCVIEKPQFEGLFENITAIGKLIGSSETAAHLNDSLRAEVNKIDIDTDMMRPTVYYVVGYGKGGNFTAGGNTFINDILTRAGCRNIADNVEGWEYSLESLLLADPDYILIRKEDAETFCKTNPYTHLSAVRKKQIIPLESAYLDLQVPRNIEGLLLIHKMTHLNGK